MELRRQSYPDKSFCAVSIYHQKDHGVEAASSLLAQGCGLRIAGGGSCSR